MVAEYAVYRYALSIILACQLLLSACGVADTANANTQRATVDGLTIALEAPADPQVNQGAEFRIVLNDAEGNPVDGADVYLELTMPAMAMGTNQPIATAQGNGVYTAQGVFDMAGAWEITVHADVEGKAHQATFASDVDEGADERGGEGGSGGHQH
jgi:nitrogen fixation protein FixH